MITSRKQQLYTVQQAARLLGIGSNTLFAKLRKLGLLDSGNVPYPAHVAAGYFKTELKNYWHGEHQRYMPYARALITVEGLHFIQRKLEQDQNHAHDQNPPLFG